MSNQNPPAKTDSDLIAKPTEPEAASVADRIAAIRNNAGADSELGHELLEDVAGGGIDLEQPVDHTDNHTDHSSG
ncbi:MAG TPA: hypothetical protein VGM86_05320 [Thermoanaerobaculia bacterium]|jgi:hypothetical protein